jgi:hypothetical protein
MKRFVARALIVVAAILGIVFAQVAPASATTTNKLASDLAALWTTVLETPSATNPFGTGGAAFACIDIGGRTVAPFAGGEKFTCTVKPGTKLFVVGFSFECSTFDDDCGRETQPDGCKGTTAPELLQCARDLDVKEAPTVKVDGKSVTVTEVEVPSLNIVLPDDNIFGEPKGTQGLSAAHGWVTLLNPLAPGTHTIKIDSTLATNTTTIVVTPGH